METFIPSTPPPSGNPAPACGQGSPAGPPDAAASPVGLFQRILSTSRAAQSAGDGNPEGATAEGKDGNAAVDDVGAGETASAESGASAVFLVVVPPLFVESGAAAGEAGTVSPEPSPAGSSAASATVGLSAALPQGAFPAPPGAFAEGSPATADANAAAISAAKDASAEGAPAEVPPVEIRPAEAARLLAASRGADARTGATTDAV
ncbi:MAG: hypothetical protein IH576_03685, partial [Deltaproteobacteria bacterium]|nr:hypothetical protein [Deltaproteobacteria bacterium]